MSFAQGSKRSAPQRVRSVMTLLAFALAWLGPTQRAGVTSAHAEAERVVTSANASEVITAASVVAPETERVDYVDRVSTLGQNARGLYFAADVIGALGAEGIIDVVKNARMNAAVIDLKDERGNVNYMTNVPDLVRSRHVTVADVPALVRELKAAHVYVIGRIVCFNDPRLPLRFPELAVRDTRPGRKGMPWGTWARKRPWLDPYNARTHGLLVEIAKEAQAMGVDEIQLDYVRFPVDRAAQYAVFPARNDASRTQAIMGMLERMDRALHIPIGVDVFGLTTMPWNDPTELGQEPITWAKHVEVFSPMLYLRGMRSWSYKNPESQKQRAERLIALGVWTLRKRIGDEPVIRPFLQGFPEGADHYDTEFIAEQIRGAKRATADGFLFWHPASRYALVREASVGGPAQKLIPFAIAERADLRARVWSEATRVD